jgi:hypothetical protein
VSLHPLLALAESRDVRHSSAFRKVAADLTGVAIAEHWAAELAVAPRRAEAGKRYLPRHGGKPPSARQRARDVEHVAGALVRACREAGAGLALPDEGSVDFFDFGVPVKAAAADPAKGGADPNRGLDRIDVLGVLHDDRLALGFLRFLEPTAARAGTGDTPLRFLLEALAHAAVVAANREAIALEVETTHARLFSDVSPALLLIACPRYWELCRRREAQRGAAWIAEMERLAREVDEQLGVSVHCLGLRLEGDPGFEYDALGARLSGPARLERAWEAGAGRVRPKPKPKPRSAPPIEVIVAPDLDRPIRAYGPHESYRPGDRIQHPTLGLGVVQKSFPGKVEVRFDAATSRLVHERPI